MDVVIPVYMPCANGLVHVFDDLPHPAVALMRIHGIQQSYPAALAAGFNGLVDWLKAACHRGAAGPSSILATSWASIQNDDVGLHQWGQGRHDTMLPSLPAPAPVPVTPPRPGLTASEARTIAREVAQSTKETENARQGFRRTSEHERMALRGYGGLSREADIDVMPFVAEWENTHQAEPAIRVMFVRRIRKSEIALDMICGVVYWTSSFMKDVKVLEWGGTLCRTWTRSTRGLTIASVFSQISTRDVTALCETEC